MTPDDEWYGERPQRRESVASQIWLAILILIFICLYFPLLAMGVVADYMSRRRLRKRTSGAIQDPAKRRPRRAF